MSEFKLKGLSTLDLADGDKLEVDVEGIEDGKVLLVRNGSEYHAISAKCTHYGAPLKNGIVNGDRITCPWHGACFNIGTGDVEDAPALDPLAKFEIVQKDSAVYIKGEEKTIKANRRAGNFKCGASKDEKIVVVGGGSGAIGTIQALREHGSKASVTLISKEGYLPIDRTKLSKALISDESKILLRPQEWFNDASVDTVTDEVVSIDFSKKSVSTKSGKSVPYTKLVLATGGTPKFLPMVGFKTLSNIFVLRTVSDVQNILAAVGDKKKNIVIVGSSFIGMEVANALAKENSVTVVGMEKVPLERVMGEEVGKIFKSQVEKSGVKLYMEAGVEKANPSKSDSKSVGSVSLKDGTELPADLVILGVGVAPATEFLKDNSSVSLEKDGSLKTNEKFEVAGLDSVYAIGDIATYPYHGPGGDGSPVRIEHWNVAQNAGRQVGSSLAGKGGSPKAFIPVFWSALGAQLRYCGNTVNGWDDMVMTGEKPSEGKFAAFYTKGETVVAVATMQTDPVMSKSAELMRRGIMPSKSELKGGKDVLGVSLAGVSVKM